MVSVSGVERYGAGRILVGQLPSKPSKELSDGFKNGRRSSQATVIAHNATLPSTCLKP